MLITLHYYSLMNSELKNTFNCMLQCQQLQHQHTVKLLTIAITESYSDLYPDQDESTSVAGDGATDEMAAMDDVSQDKGKKRQATPHSDEEEEARSRRDALHQENLEKMEARHQRQLELKKKEDLERLARLAKEKASLEKQLQDTHKKQKQTVRKKAKGKGRAGVGDNDNYGSDSLPEEDADSPPEEDTDNSESETEHPPLWADGAMSPPVFPANITAIKGEGLLPVYHLPALPVVLPSPESTTSLSVFLLKHQNPSSYDNMKMVFKDKSFEILCYPGLV